LLRRPGQFVRELLELRRRDKRNWKPDQRQNDYHMDNPVWDPLRQDPRFQVLIDKYGSKG
jgi:hypothetical protein